MIQIVVLISKWKKSKQSRITKPYRVQVLIIATVIRQ